MATMTYNPMAKDGDDNITVTVTGVGSTEITDGSVVTADLGDLTYIPDSSGNEVLEFEETASAVNHIGVDNAATGNMPRIIAKGEADTGIILANEEDEQIAIFDSVATSVNEFTISSAAANNGPQLAATGDDANIDVELIPKGSGDIVVGAGAAKGTIASSGDYDLELITGNATTGSITITDGADGDILLTPNGAGNVLCGSGAATGTMSSSGAFDLVLLTNSGTNSGQIRITDGTNGDITLALNGTGQVVVDSSDAGALGAVVSLVHDSASPAANDVVGRIQLTADDDGGAAGVIGRLDGVATDVTAGAEFGEWKAYLTNGTGSEALSATIKHDGSNGIVEAGDAAAAGVFQSDGNFDVTLRTGNSTTGSINITDGANGDIRLAPNGTGATEFYSAEAGAAGVLIHTHHDSASPADGDIISRMSFRGEDSGGTVTEYAKMEVISRDVTDTTEDGDFKFSVMRAGSITQTLVLDSDVNGAIVGDGAATGILQSDGNFDLTLQTGNATTGTVTITDGANGAVTVAPNGTGALNMTGSGGCVSGTLASSAWALVPYAAMDNIVAGAGGAISVANYYTTINTDGGGDAFTLADGSVVGQMKRIQLIADGGGDGVVTPTSLSAGTTLTFADAGDYVILQWDGSNWVAIVLSNEADGVTAPVLA